jgi:hypothetical protein
MPSVVRLLKAPLISRYVGIVSILVYKYNDNYYLKYKHNRKRILLRSKNKRGREILLSPHAPCLCLVLYLHMFSKIIGNRNLTMKVSLTINSRIHSFHIGDAPPNEHCLSHQQQGRCKNNQTMLASASIMGRTMCKSSGAGKTENISKPATTCKST